MKAEKHTAQRESATEGQAKSTPIPWCVRKHPALGCFVECPREQIGKAYGQEILADDYFPEFSREADAELIVKAVNNHSRLVEALKGLLRHAGIADASPDDIDGEDHQAESKARQVLKDLGETVNE